MEIFASELLAGNFLNLKGLILLNKMLALGFWLHYNLLPKGSGLAKASEDCQGGRAAT